MTIAIGLKFSEGILLAADTQHTYAGVMKTHRTKVYLYDFPKKSPKLAFAFSGSVEYAKMAIQRISGTVEGMKEAEVAVGSIRTKAQRDLEEIHKRNVFPHPNFGYAGGPEFQLLMVCFAGVDGPSRLFSSEESVICEVEEPYKCLGAGAYLAEYVLKRKFSTGMDLPDAAALALMVLEEVKGHVDGCGGYSELVYLRYDGSIGQILDPEEFPPASGLDST